MPVRTRNTALFRQALPNLATLVGEPRNIWRLEKIVKYKYPLLHRIQEIVQTIFFCGFSVNQKIEKFAIFNCHFLLLKIFNIVTSVIFVLFLFFYFSEGHEIISLITVKCYPVFVGGVGV